MGVLEALVGGATAMAGIASAEAMNQANIDAQRAANEANIQMQLDINEANIGFGRETNAQNLALTQQSWARDDTAVQRRTADLLAAGLNPVLAAGAGASNSSPIPMRPVGVSAARVDPLLRRLNPLSEGISLASAVMDIEQKEASIAQTREQTAVTKRQQEGLDLDNRLKAGTLLPNIEQAQARAHVAVSTQAAEIKTAEYNAQMKGDEAEEAWRYYMNRARLMGKEHEIAIWEERSRMYESWATEKYGLSTAEARLALLQAQTIGAAAASGMAEMDAQFWKKLGLSPAAGDAILQAFRAVTGPAASLAK